MHSVLEPRMICAVAVGFNTNEEGAGKVTLTV